MYRTINGQTYVVYTFSEFKTLVEVEVTEDALTGEILDDDRLVIPLANGAEQCTAVETVENAPDGTYYACKDCSRLIVDDDDFHWDINDEAVCDACFDENDYVECYDCGRVYNSEYYGSYENYACDSYGYGIEPTDLCLCEECVRNNSDYTYCEDVDMYCYYYDTLRVCGDNGNFRSPEEYARENYHYCDRCGDWVTDDVWDEEHNCCIECVPEDEDLIHYYHEHSRYEFIKFNKDGVIPYTLAREKQNALLIGIELEVERATSDATPRGEMARKIVDLIGDHVYFEEDGSLTDGFEIIFNPHTPEALLDLPLEKLLDLLKENGYRSHDGGDCGLHIHTSAEWYGDNDDEILDNVAKVLRMYTVNWDFLVACSRRTYFGFCGLAPFESYDEARYNWRVGGCHDRALNTTGLFGGTHTFEYRLGRGTLSFASFIAWVDMHLAILRNVKSIAPDDADIAKWFKGVSYDTARYIFKKTGVWVPTSAKKERRA